MRIRVFAHQAYRAIREIKELTPYLITSRIAMSGN
jgi:hypothetical protein